MSTPLTPEWFAANGFDVSEHGGYERMLSPTSWMRWKDGVVFVGNAEELDPTIDGPAQDTQVVDRVTTAEEVQMLLRNVN